MTSSLSMTSEATAGVFTLNLRSTTLHLDAGRLPWRATTVLDWPTGKLRWRGKLDADPSTRKPSESLSCCDDATPSSESSRAAEHGPSRMISLRGLVQRVNERLERDQHARAIRALERRLASEPGYYYTADYVSRHVEDWERMLQEWVDRPLQLLEVGSYEGRSTIWFLEHVLTHPGARITCVDFFPPLLELVFDHNVRVSGFGPRIRKLKGRSGDLLPGLSASSFEVIYVDGSHEAADVLLDAALCWKLLKPGGLLLFDDYLWHEELPLSRRPQMGVDLFLETVAGHFTSVQSDYQVAIRRV